MLQRDLARLNRERPAVLIGAGGPNAWNGPAKWQRVVVCIECRLPTGEITVGVDAVTIGPWTGVSTGCLKPVRDRRWVEGYRTLEAQTSDCEAGAAGKVLHSTTALFSVV